MSVRSIGELARSRSAGYLRSSKKRKGAILDEFVLATGVTRKTAIALLRKPPALRACPRGRPGKRYGADVASALEWLWAANGYLCSERLVPSLPLMMDLAQAEGSWGFSEAVREKLLRISVSTCERLLRPHKAAFRPAGRCMTRPGSMLKSQIPVRTWSDWSETEPGYCEMDLVHHCDNDTYGEYIHTLTVTDVLLGWTELQALKNRSEQTVATGVDSVRMRLPYTLKGLTRTAEESSSTRSCFVTAKSAASCSLGRAPQRRTTSAGSSRRTARSFGTTSATTDTKAKKPSGHLAPTTEHSDSE